MIHGNIYHHISCLFNSQHSYSIFIFLPGRYRAGRRRCRGEAARWGWLETSHDVAVVPTAACEKTSSRFHQVPVIFAQEASPSVFWNGKKSSFALHSSIFIFHFLESILTPLCCPTSGLCGSSAKHQCTPQRPAPFFKGT